MGMFDRIFVDKNFIEFFNIRCPKCRTVLHDTEFQTKSFDSCMDDYYLHIMFQKKLEVRLKKLDPPDKKKFWYEYTDEEIRKWNDSLSVNNSGKMLGFLKGEEGDGYYLDEAWLPENRKHRDMGELPHQWFTMYAGCDACNAEYKNEDGSLTIDSKYVSIDIRMKFTDGIAARIEIVDVD